MMQALRWLALLVLLMCSAQALAHNTGSSFSQWTLTGTSASVQARVPQLELSRLQLDPRYTADYAQTIGALLSRDLQLWSAAGLCTPTSVQAEVQAGGWVQARWSLHCQGWHGLTIRTRLLEAQAPSHLHFVRVDQPGHATLERVLSFGSPALALADRQTVTSATPQTLSHFIGVGFAHILGGWDHLAFLLMLILMASRLREVALIASGFTLAHSLTLAAAVLGWVQVEQARVEALIGFSIVLVAAENIWLGSARDAWIPGLLLLGLFACMLLMPQGLPWSLGAALLLFSCCYFGLLQQARRPLRLRLLLACTFGLVHGFGFAGLMGELRLPAAALAPALLGFNIGVELGQLLVIALIWPLLLLLRRAPPHAVRVQQGVSATVAGLGTFWFLSRILV